MNIEDERESFEAWKSRNDGIVPESDFWKFAWHGWLARAEAEGKRCSSCDGTGQVHSAGGEYLGVCSCEQGTKLLHRIFQAPPKEDGE